VKKRDWDCEKLAWERRKKPVESSFFREQKERKKKKGGGDKLGSLAIETTDREAR